MKDTLVDRLARLTDGREIDPAVARLGGEAAELEVRHPNDAFPVEYGVAKESATELMCDEGPSYYGLPMVKEPVWIWSVPAYFFVGGAAGAASTLGAVLAVANRDDDRRLLRRARWLGWLGDVASAGLLIHDLGRPSRFLNMLRVFRKGSPMSVGSWVLTASGAANTLDVLVGDKRGLVGAVGKLGGIVGGLLGMPLAGYTAVLIANTAVPLWQQTRRCLPLLFMSSAMASGAALLSLLPCDRREARLLSRYAVAGQIGALASTAMLHRDANAVPRVARPLKSGVGGALMTAATALTAASLVISVAPGRSAAKRRAAAIAGILGGLAMRFAIFHAGKASARDPHASFAQQRARRPRSVAR